MTPRSAHQRGNSTRARSTSALSATIATLAVAFTSLNGCGTASSRELAGAQISPPPIVDETPLTDLTDGDAPRSLTAAPGTLLIVYFGYTSCPDFCPTTMSDLAAARNRLDDPRSIQVAMVTVDPDRDLDVLAEYVRSFFDDGIALGSDDPAVLAAAAAPFGVSYSVTPGADSVGDDKAVPVEVAHTTSLYAVDDSGHLVLTWQYGTSVSDLTADIEQYLGDNADS